MNQQKNKDLAVAFVRTGYTCSWSFIRSLLSQVNQILITSDKRCSDDQKEATARHEI